MIGFLAMRDMVHQIFKSSSPPALRLRAAGDEGDGAGDHGEEEAEDVQGSVFRQGGSSKGRYGANIAPAFMGVNGPLSPQGHGHGLR